MKKNQNGSKVKSFLKSLPGIITSTVVLITAITGLILALKECGIKFKPDGGPEPDYVIETRSPEVVPFSLKNSMGSNHFPGWFYIRVNNSGREPLHIVISFKVRQGQAIANPEPARYTVSPGEEFTQNVSPGFTFLKDDIDVALEVIWIIRDDKGNILKQGTKLIQVLSKSILDWDLAKFEDEPVPKDFLIASLAAWILTPDSKVKECAQHLLQDIDSEDDLSLFTLRWFKHCYIEIFHNSFGLNISPSLYKFTMKGRQTIKLPSQIIEQKRANPLEAVLLLSALSREIFKREKLGVQFFLFVLPVENDISFFLSWSLGYDEWHALDMSHVAKMDFEKNKEAATSKITKLLEEKPEIISALNAKGTFIGNGALIMALDFATAAKHFRIRGM